MKVKILMDLDYYESISDDLDIDFYYVLSVEDTKMKDKLLFEYYQKRIKKNELERKKQG